MTQLTLTQWYYINVTDASGRDPDPRTFLWGTVIAHPRLPARVGTPLAVELAPDCEPSTVCQSLDKQSIALRGPGIPIDLDRLYLPLLLLGESPALLHSLAKLGQGEPESCP